MHLQGSNLHKWHEREILNHRKASGHPNVVAFKEVLTAHDHICLVMDYASQVLPPPFPLAARTT